MKKAFIFLATGFIIVISTVNSVAHFCMIIPSDSMVMQKDNRVIDITLSFSQPVEVQGMDMVKPNR